MKRLLFGAAIVLELSFLSLLLSGPSSGFGHWIIVAVAAGLVHFALCFVFFRASPIAPDDNSSRRELLLMILFIAVLFRLTLIPLDPVLSDDAYRNVWDGRVQVSGLNPYEFAPVNIPANGLEEDPVRELVNHPEYRTIYPPSAQILAFFAAGVEKVTTLGPMVTWKLSLLIIELVGMAALGAALLWTRGRVELLIAWAWSPLAVIEFAGSGHVDGAALGLLGIALALFLVRRPLGSSAAFAASVLVKFITAPAVLFFLVRKEHRFKMILAMGLTMAALSLPYLSAGTKSLESLDAYTRNWEFNGVVHRSLQVDGWVAAGRRIVRPGNEALFAPGQPLEKALGRLALSLAVLGFGLFQIRRGVRPAKVAVYTMAGFLLVQPVVYPWYLANLLPLLVFTPSSWLILLLALSPLTYEAAMNFHETGIWREDVMLQTAILVPPLILAIGTMILPRVRRYSLYLREVPDVP